MCSFIFLKLSLEYLEINCIGDQMHTADNDMCNNMTTTTYLSEDNSTMSSTLQMEQDREFRRSFKVIGYCHVYLN